MLHWLTTVLARLTRRGPAGPPPRLGWNGRPWVGAAQGRPSPGQPDPDAKYSTLGSSVPPGGPEPTRAPAPPAG
jgi:hypothetical protein